MRRLAALLMLFLLAPLLPATSGTGTPDPTATGSLAVTRQEYHFGYTLVSDPTLVAYTYPVELRGSVHHPLTGTDLPLVLLLHGRHTTCNVLGVVEFGGSHFCPDTHGLVRPIDSYNGYDHLATNLASHGYVVVSVDANQVNDRDLLGDGGAHARAELLLTTLQAFSDADATGRGVPALKGRIDMDSIGIMGHSRGGQGAVAAVALDQARTTPYGIDAVFALAPTAFDRPTVVGVPFATLLPYCDGDVTDLQGAWMYDDSRYLSGAGPLYQFLALGSNHNDHNTRWTYDDWAVDDDTDPHCSRSVAGHDRDTEVEVLQQGLATAGAFLRAHVGGEGDLLPYLTGETAWPVTSTLHTSHHPASSGRVVLDDGSATWTASGATATRCTAPACPAEDTVGTSTQLVVEVASSGSVSTTFPSTSLTGRERISLRVGVDPGHPTTTAPILALTLTDGGGASGSVTITDDAVFHPPGDVAAKTVLNMASVDLAAFSGVDLTDVTGVTLSVSGASRVQFTDLMARDV